MTMTGRRYVTIQDESRRLGVSYRHLRSMIKNRTVPCLRFGRKTIRLVPDEVDRALDLHFRQDAAA